jgi:hypothetical protein
MRDDWFGNVFWHLRAGHIEQRGCHACLIYARTADSRDAFVQQWPDLGARAANNIDEIIASVVD